MNKELVFESELLDEHAGQIRGNEPLARFQSLPSINRLIGGVYSGLLTVMGAQPSCGKTTLMGQMSDDLAGQGHPVIVISSELPSFRIVEKSIVRCSGGAFSLSEVTEAAGEADGCGDFSSAKERYARECAPNTCIIDAPLTIPDLGRIVGNCIHQRGQTPVLFIDYLQLVATAGLDATGDERIAISNCVRMLSNLAKSYGTPVFLLSSITRNSYNKQEVGLDVFGGSQAIEYGIDNALYLAVDGAGKAERQANMECEMRPMLLKALKVRYGSVETVTLGFDAAHATFRDTL